MWNGNGWERMLAAAVLARGHGLLDPERAAPARWSGRRGARPAAASGAARRFVRWALDVVFGGGATRPIGAARPREDGAG